jgi:lipoate-protein ligase A
MVPRDSPFPLTVSVPWRWIPPLLADGVSQMAIDALLLQQLAAAGAGGRPALRLYGWRRPTLSLGYHQRQLEPHWPALAAAGRIALVRRPSGGRAVLHAGELTYALVQPATGRRVEVYAQACQWLLQAFADLGQPLHWGAASPRLAQQRSSCFGTATAADLLHVTGAKRIGSAQLWRGGHVLQHGSVLLAPPADLWQEVFGSAPPALPPLPVGWPELTARLRAAAEQHLCPSGLEEEPLSQAEWAEVDCQRGFYGLEDAEAPLLEAEASGLESSDRATVSRAMPSG